MTLRNLRDSDLQYHLISYDTKGVERTDDPDAINGRLSEDVFATLDKEPISDVFIFSHGWLNDFEGAIKSYNQWIGAMLQCEHDLQAMRQARPRFNPLLIGIHWRSRPFGNEDLNSDVSFGVSTDDPFADLIDEAAESIADTPKARAALQIILASAADDLVPDEMPQEVIDAYQVLWQEAGLDLEGPAGAPGNEAQSFEPEALFEESLDGDLSFGGGILSGLLSPLNPLSFWKMKKRARSFGESGGADLLRQLQKRTDAKVRFHLMGHSFGCIVVSSMVAGSPDGEPPLRPVDSVFLAQGAVSCWSYTPSIPIAKGQAGYFCSIPLEGKVAGPIVTTQSKFDKAVSTAYRLAVTRRSVSFAPGAGDAPEAQRPRADGSLGTFGIQGPGVDVVTRPMLDVGEDYAFETGRIYNLESSRFICEGRLPLLGAHCDIAKPEVAHAFWSAVMTGLR